MGRRDLSNLLSNLLDFRESLRRFFEGRNQVFAVASRMEPMVWIFTHPERVQGALCNLAFPDQLPGFRLAIATALTQEAELPYGFER